MSEYDRRLCCDDEIWCWCKLKVNDELNWEKKMSEGDKDEWIWVGVSIDEWKFIRCNEYKLVNKKRFKDM